MPLILTISSSENCLLPSTRMDSTGKGFEGSTTTCCLLAAGAGFLRTGGTAETTAAANRTIPTVRRTGTLIGRLSRPPELQILLIMTTAPGGHHEAVQAITGGRTGRCSGARRAPHPGSVQPTNGR